MLTVAKEHDSIIIDVGAAYGNISKTLIQAR